jgi:hypothetical protein
MSYENSEACKMVATCCACCARPLVDAVSVELGMGPICRKKHGYDEGPAENRKRANKLVYWIAAKQHGDEVAQWVVELRELGFVKLADVIIDRLDNVLRITRDGATYLVRAPLRRDAFDAWHRLPGAYWDRKRKVRVVPARSYATLWALLDRFFHDMKIVGEPRPAPVATPPEPLAPDAPPTPAPVEIKVVQNGDGYLVFPPFRDDLVSAWPQEVAGAYWDGVNRCRRVPLTSRDALWAFLKRHFVGAVLVTAKGRTVIG